MGRTLLGVVDAAIFIGRGWEGGGRGKENLRGREGGEERLGGTNQGSRREREKRARRMLGRGDKEKRRDL